jgi:hypothetical protein
MTEPFGGVIGRYPHESKPWWPAPRRAPAGAPNVLLVVLDDVGFAQLGCFGSDIETPALDRLAAGGLRYANFHTTALCSPTRSCLLTGRNHHANGVGIIQEMATGFPGYNGSVPRENGFLSEMLLQRGYATFAIGKWHLTLASENASFLYWIRVVCGTRMEREHVSSASPFQENRFLATPIRDLGLSIAGTQLEAVVDEFQRELEQIGIRRLKPDFHLSTEWGVPFESISIGIPFYLARPELVDLHALHVGHLEGVGRAELLRYLRHEMGHVVNYAYRLYEQEGWIKLFGSITRPYLEEYRPEPFSQRYVWHLPGWYVKPTA